MEMSSYQVIPEFQPSKSEGTLRIAPVVCTSPASVELTFVARPFRTIPTTHARQPSRCFSAPSLPTSQHGQDPATAS